MLWGREAAWKTPFLHGGRAGGMPFLWWDLGLGGCTVQLSGYVSLQCFVPSHLLLAR